LNEFTLRGSTADVSIMSDIGHARHWHLEG